MLFFGVLSSLGLISTASADELDLQVDFAASAQHVVVLPQDLRLRTTWPTSCLPSVERTTIDAMRINIHLRPSSAQCVKVPTPLTLKVNPARDAGRKNLELGVYEVRLFLSNGNESSELIAFSLLEAGRESNARPESGFWWSVSGDDNQPTLSGSGITLEQQGDNLAVTLLSYEAGSPVWFFGSGSIRGRIAHVPLLRMRGGPEPFSNVAGAPEADSGPILYLDVHGPARAQAWLTRPRFGSANGIETQSIQLMRLPFESETRTPWQGQWILRQGTSRSLQLFEFSHAMTSDAQSLRLVDETAGVALQCRVALSGGHAMPTLCSLIDDAKGIIAEFDRVGLNRIDGFSTNGDAIELVRLPR